MGEQIDLGLDLDDVDRDAQPVASRARPRKIYRDEPVQDLLIQREEIPRSQYLPPVDPPKRGVRATPCIGYDASSATGTCGAPVTRYGGYYCGPCMSRHDYDDKYWKAEVQDLWMDGGLRGQPLSIAVRVGRSYLAVVRHLIDIGWLVNGDRADCIYMTHPDDLGGIDEY